MMTDLYIYKIVEKYIHCPLLLYTLFLHLSLKFLLTFTLIRIILST